MSLAQYAFLAVFHSRRAPFLLSALEQIARTKNKEAKSKDLPRIKAGRRIKGFKKKQSVLLQSGETQLKSKTEIHLRQR